MSLAFNGQLAEETLLAKECRVLADATALKVALAIDPLATARVIAATQERNAQSVATHGGTPSTRAAPKKPSITQAGVRLDLGVGLGLLPGLSLGGGLGAWLQRFAWRAELSGRAFAGDAVHHPHLPAAGARLQLFSGLLRACHIGTVGVIDAPLCLGVEAGAARGVGFGLESTSTSLSAWGALVLGPGLRLPVSHRVALWLEANAVVSFLRPGFTVRNLGTLYAAPPVTAAIWAGCEIRLSQ